MLFMEVDRFKRINDSLGHEGGDAVLAEVAQRLGKSVRAVDTVSRFGGDEFVVLCEDVAPDDAFGLARSIEQALAGPIHARGREVPVSFSIGLAVHAGRGDARTAADLLRDADIAMYRAKDLGRGRTEMFDAELHERAQSRLDAEVALRRAVDRDELLLRYQPIVALPRAPSVASRRLCAGGGRRPASSCRPATSSPLPRRRASSPTSGHGSCAPPSATSPPGTRTG
jgi:diguanylate cyclase (GGDEF)-like protein